MNIRKSRGYAVFGYLMLVFFIGITAAVTILEFIVEPLLLWAFVGASYHLPSIADLYKCGKFIGFSTLVCSTGQWIYWKVTSGR
jgi:hypothetical protein